MFTSTSDIEVMNQKSEDIARIEPEQRPNIDNDLTAPEVTNLN